MFIGSTLGRIAVTRARAEAVIAQLDSRLKNSERELRTGAADRDRTAALTDECASLVGIARGWGAEYFPNFGAGGGELRRARDLVPQVELAAGAEVAAADSLDGKDFVDFGELTDLVDLRAYMVSEEQNQLMLDARRRQHARHGVQTPTEHQKAVGALGNQTHLTGCVTTSQTAYEQQKMPEIRFSPSFPPFTAPLKEVNWSTRR